MLGDLEIHSAKRLNTIKPAKSTKANSVFESLPAAHLALNTTLNINVYIKSINKGFIKDHIIPIIEP